jgi:hypothetical protein
MMRRVFRRFLVTCLIEAQATIPLVAKFMAVLLPVTLEPLGLFAAPPQPWDFHGLAVEGIVEHVWCGRDAMSRFGQAELAGCCGHLVNACYHNAFQIRTLRLLMRLHMV